MKRIRRCAADEVGGSRRAGSGRANRPKGFVRPLPGVCCPATWPDDCPTTRPRQPSPGLGPAYAARPRMQRRPHNAPRPPPKTFPALARLAFHPTFAPDGPLCFLRFCCCPCAQCGVGRRRGVAPSPSAGGRVVGRRCCRAAHPRLHHRPARRFFCAGPFPKTVSAGSFAASAHRPTAQIGRAHV